MGVESGNMERVAIVEPSHSHEEVILPQIELLRARFDLSVVAPQSLLDVDLLHETSHLYHARAFAASSAKNRTMRLLDKPRHYLAIRKVIREIDPSVIIFNSTYTSIDIALIRWLFRDYKKIQIIHNFQKFLAPFSRGLYRAFDGNLVISEQVHAYVTGHHPGFADLKYFLPIFFDSFLSGGVGRVDAPTSVCPQLKLGVFGSIENDRRNYSGLLDAVRRLRASREDAAFRVYLVGKAPQEIQAYIREHNLQSVVQYYTEFVPFRTMFALLAEMDIVLFLIDREVGNMKHYNHYKISGTSTLMKGFRKAGASSTDFPVDSSLADKCFYYPGGDIGRMLSQINDGSITAADARRRMAAYEGQSLFSFSAQQARLVSIIQRVIRS
ncbi:MAG: hypothetical protein NT167_30250 [Verrucomicrobia bacterium]|nr:hypothetical protein [Verrucomicrobiota bacterium]